MKKISAKEFDKKFDAGEDIIEYLDLDKSERPGLKKRRVSFSLPVWMIDELDKKARRLGVTRQSIIKVWIADRLSKL